MFRHVVIWSVKGEDQQTVKSNALIVKNHLLTLKDSVPFVRSISVGIDFRNESDTIFLDVLLDKQEDLPKYAEHPEHLKVADKIKIYLKDRKAVDYEE